MIKISIIVPVYNNAKYLEKCLSSIMFQSLKEIEIICVNDGSLDNSLEILKIYQKQDARIKIIDKKNEGASRARNVAIEIACGEYCLNVDSDDWLEKDYLKNLYEKAKKNDLDILITDILLEYPNGKKSILKDLLVDDSKILNSLEYIKIFLKENFHGYSCNKLIKRELYKKNRIEYTEEIFSGEDVECLLRLAYYAKKIGKLNNIYYHYRQGENNGNKKIKLKSLEDSFIVFENLERFYKDKNKEIYRMLKERKYPILFGKTLRYNEYFSNEVEYQVLKKKIILEIINDKRFSISKINRNDFFIKDRVLFFLVHKRIINADLIFNIFSFLKKIKKGIKNEKRSYI